MTAPYVPEIPFCDYCDGAAITRAARLDDTGDEYLCARHGRRVDPELVTARWTGTYWQAVR